MKKLHWLGIGAASLLAIGALPVYLVVQSVQDIRKTWATCEPIIPTLNTYTDDVSRFYNGVYKRTMTPALARQLATHLDKQLPTLAQTKVTDPGIQLAHDNLIEQMRLVPPLAREWATLNPTFIDYLKFREKRYGHRFRPEGGREFDTIAYLYCKYPFPTDDKGS